MPPDNEDLDEVLKMISVLLRDGNLSSSKTADQMAAEDAKDPVKTVQERATSNEHATLETLPNEIISSIAGMLAVSIDVPYVVSRPSLATSPQCKREDADARRDLTSLCMVSKRISATAEIALYRNVLITDANTLILLYRTFLENSKLTIHVKRMSLNIDHARDNGWTSFFEDDWRVFNGKPIHLSPLLSCAQHGLGKQFPEAVQNSRRALRKIPVEIFFTLQFRILGLTSNLESLDINLHPFLPLIRKHTKQNMKKQHWQELGTVLCSLWEEVCPCLSGVKKLQMTGNHEPLGTEEVLVARQLFDIQICRCFLKLSNLEHLAWVNFSQDLFEALPFLLVSGIGTESRFESVRVLELEESPCLPQNLNTICSAFPNLQSLSVHNGVDHAPGSNSWISTDMLRANEDSTPNAGGSYLTNSLTALKDLKTLRFNLHFHHEIMPTLGPLGALSLAGLANLETLEIPFHCFARFVLPEGDHRYYHKIISPESLLPRALKTLKIMACYNCDDFCWFDGKKPFDVFRSWLQWPEPCRHAEAVVNFLEMLACFKDEYFPSLEYVCYEEVKLDEDQYDKCPACRRPAHLRSNQENRWDLELVEELFLEKGILFENHSDSFHCDWTADDPWILFKEAYFGILDPYTHGTSGY